MNSVTSQQRPKSDAVIVYGPQGCGKTTHAAAIASFYGKPNIVDDWTPGDPVPADTLILTSEPHQGAIPFVDAVSFAGISVARTAARKPLTEVPTGPLTADKLKAILRFCAERAAIDEPNSADCRARMFVAVLSGRLGNYDEALSDFIFDSILIKPVSAA